MRRSIRLALFALALAAPAHAAAPDPELKKFIAAFAEALKAKTPDTAAKLAHFPIRNAVYQEPETVSAKDFKSHFNGIKLAEFIACLKANAPTRSPAQSRRLGEWSVDCNGNIFYFGKFDGAWRYSGFENVNE